MYSDVYMQVNYAVPLRVYSIRMSGWVSWHNVRNPTATATAINPEGAKTATKTAIQQNRILTTGPILGHAWKEILRNSQWLF